jgi:uncharacterized membrane protein YccC
MYFALSNTGTTIVAGALFALMLVSGSVALAYVLAWVDSKRRDRKVASLDDDFQRVLIELLNRRRTHNVGESGFLDQCHQDLSEAYERWALKRRRWRRPPWPLSEVLAEVRYQVGAQTSAQFLKRLGLENQELDMDRLREFAAWSRGQSAQLDPSRPLGGKGPDAAPPQPPVPSGANTNEQSGALGPDQDERRDRKAGLLVAKWTLAATALFGAAAVLVAALK